ncbi:bifunctional DNA-formamidopyrimidine glycosylase/DNA-(apurinic or apyrimidinic site) lyase [Agromyces archimandritae]|uniref:Formamidopyrimidine-DNA glycosylase n=1 Tax=Agromyces archimandritae TaxID=2781962 RepID=A0A975INP6_9MICO|nr:bifunctional DNA-formamidopyrimidine glycosylase/DNA-(apurinic or apyrimidinic site) lyase [Agromyces archimandritae]QTX04459.1 bifunctional DNA-formamidopyrimidine glycosylase/DNA-(apurinic or apyrimidinic site) lyase [Agromyces archimandritae]
MPELPEVEVVRAGLAPAVAGARVSAVEVLDERALTRHDRRFGDFESLLTGARIAAAVRRGKFLWMPLHAPSGASHLGTRHAPAGASHLGASAEPVPARAVVGHLGMSGQLLLRTPDHRGDDRHARVRIHLEHPAHGELRVDFIDQRTFGSLAVDRLVPTPDGEIAGFAGGVGGDWERLVPSQVAHIGRDPLDPAFDDAAYLAGLRRRTSAVKRVLLDQSLASGIGNIYADEALWAARLHPEQPASTLSTRAARTLLAEIRHVLAKALAEGGTSFDAQYVNVNGQAGYFAHSLNAYGRTGRPCPRCGTPIVRDAFMNRSSHRCPRCQRMRRPAQR